MGPPINYIRPSVGLALKIELLCKRCFEYIITSFVKRYESDIGPTAVPLGALDFMNS
jgi:hypothetical protein